MKDSLVAPSPVRGREKRERREGNGRRPSFPLAQSHGQRPTPPPQGAGGPALGHSKEVASGKQISLGERGNFLVRALWVGGRRPPPPAPATTGSRGESMAEGKKGPPPRASARGWGVIDSGAPRPQPPATGGSQHAGTRPSTPQDVSQGAGG